STFASGRIMASWLLMESGAQHPGSAKRFECEVYGALTFHRVVEPVDDAKTAVGVMREMRGEKVILKRK
ncbi:hypothetical protein, partial [Pseudomonas koreensis]|uniref:hypothetical protein n=1 Tax=Pseudomonas koreensis TaxID=198620 RepID=UPI00320A1A36